jgi:maleylpyruvate isomerase
VPDDLRGGQAVTLPGHDVLLGWAADGQARVEAAAVSLTDADVRAPSALTGWSRGHLLSHLARNADALVNLLTWARTGVETPMYAGPEQRAADIEAGAGRPADELRADLRDAGQRFAHAAAAITDWTTKVRTRAAREIGAAEIPWLRVREVWVHLIDLDVGATVDELPDEIAWQLIGDTADSLTPRVLSTAELHVTGRGTVRLGDGAPTGELRGPAPRIAGWLTGRSGAALLHTSGTIPELPAWL